jgi:hypothetical protein
MRRWWHRLDLTRHVMCRLSGVGVCTCSPSVLLRQSVLRVLLPVLLHIDAGGNESRLRQLFHRTRDQWRRAIEQMQMKQPTTHAAGSSEPTTHGVVSSSPFLSPSCLADVLTHEPQLDLLMNCLCAHYSHLFGALTNADRRQLDVWMMEVILVSSSPRHTGHVSADTRERCKFATSPVVSGCARPLLGGSEWSVEWRHALQEAKSLSATNETIHEASVQRR